MYVPTRCVFPGLDRTIPWILVPGPSARVKFPLSAMTSSPAPGAALQTAGYGARASAGGAAEARELGLRRERARRQTLRRVLEVEGARGDVVGRVGVEDRGEQLDLAAPDAVLTH